tara:strand:+ start:8018 stop:8374 length:357 start_codon:yes stop_codon:yes gene_type:complete
MVNLNKSTVLRLYGIFFWASYIITFIGIANVNIEYLQEFNVVIRTIIALILMYRFRPYWLFNKNPEFTEDDWNFVFAASFYLFATTTLNTIIKTYFKNFFTKITGKDLAISNNYKNKI